MKRDPLVWLRRQGWETAGLTGQDTRALIAIARCWELYSVSDATGAAAALGAVRALLAAMQPYYRPLARELITYAVDGANSGRLWASVIAGPQ